MLHQANHRGVDMLAECKNRIKRRPRKRGAKLLLRHVAERVVVAVEEPAKFWVKRLITGRELPQHKRLKEPAGVRKVPLHGTSLWTRLHHHVFWRQRNTKLPGSLANRLVPGEQRGCGGDGFCTQGHGLLAS